MSASSSWARATVLLAALTLGTAGCRKTLSQDYVQAAKLFDSIRAQRGADAVKDPRMAQVEALLKQVPADSLSRPAADALQKRISDERAALAGGQEAREKLMREALKPPDVRFAPSLPKSVPIKETELPTPDAGAAQPVAGMSVNEFSQRFSGCFRPDASLDVLGKGRLETYALKDIANCRDRHPGFDGQLVLIEKGQILTTVDRSAARAQTISDGGAPKAR